MIPLDFLGTIVEIGRDADQPFARVAIERPDGAPEWTVTVPMTAEVARDYARLLHEQDAVTLMLRRR